MLRWGLIGASTVADEWMVSAMRAVGDTVQGVVSADAERAQAFAQKHTLSNDSTCLEDMVHWGVDAVYISSTNEKHEAQTLFAAAQGLPDPHHPNPERQRQGVYRSVVWRAAAQRHRGA